MKVCFIDVRKNYVLFHFFNKKASRFDLTESARIETEGDYRLPDTVSLPVADKYYLGIPVSLLNFRILEMPFCDREKLKATIPYELGGIISRPVDSVVYDCAVTNEMSSSGKYQVFVFFMDRKVLKDFLNGCQRLSIDPVAVTSLDVRAGLERLGIDNIVNGEIELSEKESIPYIIDEMTSPVANLRSGDLAYGGDAAKGRKWFISATLLFYMTIITISLYAGYNILSAEKMRDSIKSSMADSYKEIFHSSNVKGKTLYLLKSALKTAREEEVLFTGIKPLDFFKALSFINDFGAVVFEIEIKNDLVVIRGEADSMSDVEHISSGLRKISKNIRVLETGSSAAGGIVFAISMSLPEG